MAEVRLVTFNGQTVTPQDDSILYQSATVDGIYNNASFTIADPTTIHVGGTFAIMGGRFIEISEQDITVSLATTSSDLTGQIYLKMDLSNIDAPLDMIAETATSESELTPMTTDPNVNVDNGVYMMRLVLFGVSNSTVYNKEDSTSTTIPVIANILPTNNNFTNANIAPIEERVSTRAYAAGSLLVYNLQLYKTTTSIAIGTVLEPGINITPTTIDTSVSSQISNLENKVVKSVNGQTPNSSGDVAFSYIKTFNDFPADSNNNFKLREGVNAVFHSVGLPTPGEYPPYYIASTGKAKSFSGNILSAILGTQTELLYSDRSSYYNTYIKTDTENCADAPVHHKTEKASVYVVRDVVGFGNRNVLNATCLWVSLNDNSLVFKRSIVNGAWNGGWRFVGGRDLLWTNTNPTAHFAPATITKDLSEYNNILIYFKQDVDASNPVFNSLHKLHIGEGQQLCSAIYPENSRLLTVARLVQVDATKINFGWKGWYWASPNFTRTDDNSVMVPLYIFGI